MHECLHSVGEIEDQTSDLTLEISLPRSFSVVGRVHVSFLEDQTFDLTLEINLTSFFFSAAVCFYE